MNSFKRLLAFGALAIPAITAGAANAHTSLAPHAHPHGDTLVLGIDGLLIAMVTAATVVGLVALAVGRARPGALATRRRKS
jgi:hypothetical protein